jgi:hypothetical protein
MLLECRGNEERTRKTRYPPVSLVTSVLQSRPISRWNDVDGSDRSRSFYSTLLVRHRQRYNGACHQAFSGALDRAWRAFLLLFGAVVLSSFLWGVGPGLSTAAAIQQLLLSVVEGISEVQAENL